MSASSKKKFRKEQVAAQMTEKQRQQQAEAKKLKTYTIIFVTVMVLVVGTVLGILAARTVDQSGVIDRNTMAASIGDYEISSAKMAYYYGDAIQAQYYNWYQTYGEYASMYLQWTEGLDLTQPLNTQIKNAETGETWADYFVATAVENAKSDYILFAKAVEDKFELPEEAKAELEETIHSVEDAAEMYGYSSANAYLKATYGYGSDLDGFSDYLEFTALADAYYNAHLDSLVYDDAALRAHEEGRYNEYSSFTGAYAYISYTSFREGGVTDENGNTTYTEEQNTAARAKAKEVAESLMGATSVDELKQLVENHEVNTDTVLVNVVDLDRTLYSGVPEGLQEWISDAERKENDITLIPNVATTTDEDGKETSTENGYYVAVFQERTDNLEPIANVRHLLVAFEGGTEDENGDTIYSDEEIAAAKTEAEGYLKAWKEGEATEESFIALVKEHSDDSSASEGGLFEDVTPDSNYVPEFLNWSVDPSRVAGDAEVIETEYGYHVMFYVGDDEMNYRDYMLTNELKTTDMEEWYSALLETDTITLKDISRLRLDLVLESSY